MNRASYGTESLAINTLIAGDFPRVTRKVTIAAGTALPMGALLGQITASTKYVLSLAASSDGSQAPSAILAEDLDASGSDRQAIVYFTGEFRSDGMTFGTGHTASSTRGALRALSIFTV